ncbi:FAD-dependent oxidoreductase [Bacillus massilinigeriensis]|uniref:FAD-dependent oxidoreductase n=1 Tax=Bacillus mediterraneensis TaxID=1805474 RepID=UPI0008F8B10F|nr:FAD-dependent oxidoreductase [Bacillus mediterraneensis]
MAGEKVAVIGGGISGLCTALALQQRGIQAEVYEQGMPEDYPRAGMILGGNALICLEMLGLREAVWKNSIGTDCYTIRADSGKVISTLKYSSPVITSCFRFIYGPLLLTLLASELSPGTLHFGQKLDNFERNKNSITLFFEGGETKECSYMLACDGLHSLVRRKLLPDSSPVASGYTCWRGILDHDGEFSNYAFSETWGHRGRFGIVPLPNNQIYWYAVRKCEGQEKAMNTWASIDLLFNFFYYHDPIQQILERTKDNEIIHHDIFESKSPGILFFGCILLLGDAAHSPLLNMGQGASLAIEDAVTLAASIASEESTNKGFTQYSKSHARRARKVSSHIRKFDWIAKMELPFLCSMRNCFLSLAPSSFHGKRLGDLFDITPWDLSSG